MARKNRSTLVPIAVTTAVVAAAFVFNPSPDRHRLKIREAMAQRSTIARVLSLGSLAAFASNYHSLGVASYTKVGDRMLSVGFMGYVHVPE
jgi:hypothetical protein